MLLDRPIKLCHGPGNGVDQACLMTASNMLVGNAGLGDEASCQCLVIRHFIIPTNDQMPIELLWELYGPLAWDIVGTATGDKEVMSQRAEAFASLARTVCAAVLEKAYRRGGLVNSGQYLEAMVTGSTEMDRPTARSEIKSEYAASIIVHGAYCLSDCEHKVIKDRTYWEACRDAILEACAIGDKRPVELAMTPQQLCESLS